MVGSAAAVVHGTGRGRGRDMAGTRPTTRAERKAKAPAALPATFQPRFLDRADKRQGTIRAIRDRVERLREDAGADSYQKEMLVRRAVFIAVQLETMEVTAAERGPFDAGVYTQMANALSGLLSKLGLERKAKKAESLAEYVGGRR